MLSFLLLILKVVKKKKLSLILYKTKPKNQTMHLNCFVTKQADLA